VQRQGPLFGGTRRLQSSIRTNVLNSLQKLAVILAFLCQEDFFGNEAIIEDGGSFVRRAGR